jgi:hypothetical protein
MLCAQRLTFWAGVASRSSIFFHCAYRPPLSTLNLFSPVDFAPSLCYTVAIMRTYTLRNYILILPRFAVESIVKDMGFTRDRMHVGTLALDIVIQFRYEEDAILFELLGGVCYVVNKAWDLID